MFLKITTDTFNKTWVDLIQKFMKKKGLGIQKIYKALDFKGDCIMKVIVKGPALTRTGYGEHCRFVLRALRQFEGLDIYLPS